MLLDKLDTAKMHGLDTSNVSCPVVSTRDEPRGIWAIAYSQNACTFVYFFVFLHMLLQLVPLFGTRETLRNFLYVLNGQDYRIGTAL